MNTYGKIAIKAVKYVNDGLSAEQAWEQASCEYYEKGSASQSKGCPRGAFLGLFSKEPKKLAGKNAAYAKKALEILKNNLDHTYTEKELWALVTDGNKTHNSQMAVVLALWENDLIESE